MDETAAVVIHREQPPVIFAHISAMRTDFCMDFYIVLNKKICTVPPYVSLKYVWKWQNYGVSTNPNDR